MLERSRENSTRLGITGMLLYKGGNLMQVLEGDEATVRALYARIEADTRHKGLIVLMEGRRDSREFPDWSMAFRDLDAAETQAAPGYDEFLNTPLTAAAFGAESVAVPEAPHELQALDVASRSPRLRPMRSRPEWWRRPRAARRRSNRAVLR